MKIPRREFLHLAAGAAALPTMPRIAIAPSLSDASDHSGGAGWCRGTDGCDRADCCRAYARVLGRPVIIETWRGLGFPSSVGWPVRHPTVTH